MLITLDAKGGKTYREEKAGYERVRRAELRYGIKLRKVARNCGDIVKEFPPGDPKALAAIQALLRKYAELLKPWAEVVAASMLADVARRDEENWNELAVNMGSALRLEMLKAPTGQRMRELQAEQVRLITSIPLKAAERVHKLTMEGLINATRAKEIADDIRRTTHVTESRATLIARTEVGRASTNLAQARAEFVGSEGYIWRTARDRDVRPSHKKLEGKFFEWSKPPICDPPAYRAHPGSIWNCRCYPEIGIPDKFRR